MGLQLIIGGSGTGKTTLMYEKLLAHSKAEKNIRCYAVVPEQFTMETQKNIVALSDTRGTMSVDIVSFQRLAGRIFEEAGLNRYQVLDDTGKCFILRKIIEENKKSFTVFGNKAGMAGFIEEMKSMISEFYQYGIVGEKLDAMLASAEARPLLHAKLSDVRLCMQKLQEFLGERFTMNEELLSRACSLIGTSRLIKGSYITFDEYTGFSPIQYQLIRELLKTAKDVCVTITLREGEIPDGEAQEQKKPTGEMSEREMQGQKKSGKITQGKNANDMESVFGLSLKTIRQLKQIAKEENVPVYPEVVLTENRRLKGKGALLYLEKNLFRYGVKPYEMDHDLNKDQKLQEQISIHLCDNTLMEAEYAAYTICQLVREQNYRFRDIAVVTPDMAGYSRIIEETFEKYSLPCFVDDKRSVVTNPVVETLRAVLEIISENFSYESVFRYLKGGLSQLPVKERDLLENYAIRHGLRGRKKWLTAIEDAREEYELARQKVLEEVLPVYDTFKAARKIKVATAVAALEQFLSRLDFEKILEDLIDSLMQNGDPEKAKELSQTCAIMEELFEKLVFLTGEEYVNARELAAMLESGFEDIRVSIVPPTLDRVVVGDLERTRLNQVKVLFLVGANDGLIPRTAPAAGVLTREERNFLCEQGVELSPTVRENAFIQKFYLYLLLTKMSDRLVISLKRTNNSGEVARPSYLVGMLQGMFRNMVVTDEAVQAEGRLPKKVTNQETAYAFVARNIYAYVTAQLNDNEKQVFAQVYTACKERGLPVEKLLSAVTAQERLTHIDRAVAKVLYGENLHNSVSRLETFARCAYQHFVTYGLALLERREYEVQKNDIGTVYHKVMQLFFEKVHKRNLSFAQISKELRKQLLAECMSEIASGEMGKIFKDSGRNQYILDKIRRISDKTLWILQEQVSAGDFVPSEFELRFSAERGLDRMNYYYEDGTQMELRGVIDRVDYYREDDDVYVKIIDYKSGRKSFAINDVYDGLQLQLVIYMDAALEHAKKRYPDKNIIPAGMFYYNIDEPVIKEEELSDLTAVSKPAELAGSKEISKPETLLSPEDLKRQQEINRFHLEKQKVNGVVNDDEKVLKHFDRAIPVIRNQGGASAVLPVAFNKDGSFKSSSSQTDLLSLTCLLQYAHDKAGEYGREILEGNIAVNPYRRGGQTATACDYCEYQSICGFDKNERTARYRLLKKEQDTTVWNNIRKEAIEREKEKKHGMDNSTEESH